MKRRLSQKLAVKYDGETLLDKVFIFATPYEGYCFVAWVSHGVNFGIYYNTVRDNSKQQNLEGRWVVFPLFLLLVFGIDSVSTLFRHTT